MDEIKNDDVVTINVTNASSSHWVPIGPIYISRGSPIRNIAMDVTERAGPPIRIKGEIVKATSSIEEENARLRTELTQAKEMALAATAETAMVRNSLKLVLNEHDKECTELERTIARQVVLIHEQARMIATAAEQSRKDQAPVKAIEHADWTPPAGLPRGMR